MTLQKLLLSVLSVIACPVALVAADPVTVSVKTSDPGAEIPQSIMGLSYETSLMRPDTNGVRYFRPDNQALATLFKTIGIKNLRVGGSAVNSTKQPMPSQEDIASFFDFAKQAGVKVIYSMRMADSKDVKVSDNIELATKAATLIHSRYTDQLDLFAFGNEPHYFLSDPDKYVKKWKILRDAVIAGYPEAKFCGPDAWTTPDLFKKMAVAYGNPSGRLESISHHSYPFGSSYKNNIDPDDLLNRTPYDAAESREKMLSPEAYATYEKIHKGIVDCIQGTPLKYRVTECNSYSSSGLKGASDSYASALWAADYLYWWANHGVEGMNFHTGDRTGGDVNFICRYAAFRTSDHGYDVYPLSYGMKLFDVGGHGRILPTSVKEGEGQNLAAYSTLSKDKTVSVTLINKAHGPKATEQLVKITPDQPLEGSKVEFLSLLGRNNDIAGSLGDVTLGGEPIKEDGTWNGQWKELPASAVTNGTIAVTMPPASAAVVRFRTK